VWVASGIKAIQVIDEGREVVRVIEIAMGGRSKGYGGRAEAAVRRRQVASGAQGSESWPGGDGG
jgi:hypothetical protein